MMFGDSVLFMAAMTAAFLTLRGLIGDALEPRPEGDCCPDWLAVRRTMAADVVRFLEDELEQRAGGGDDYEMQAVVALEAARLVAGWLEEQDRLHGAPIQADPCPILNVDR